MNSLDICDRRTDLALSFAYSSNIPCRTGPSVSKNCFTAALVFSCSFSSCSASKALKYRSHVSSRAGIGSLGSLSWNASVRLLIAEEWRGHMGAWRKLGNPNWNSIMRNWLCVTNLKDPHSWIGLQRVFDRMALWFQLSKVCRVVYVLDQVHWKLELRVF